MNSRRLSVRLFSVFFAQVLHNILEEAVSIFLLVRQQFEHIDQICTDRAPPLVVSLTHRPTKCSPLGFIDGTSGKLLNHTLVEKAKKLTNLGHS